jgi:hypothetical protein
MRTKNENKKMKAGQKAYKNDNAKWKQNDNIKYHNFYVKIFVTISALISPIVIVENMTHPEYYKICERQNTFKWKYRCYLTLILGCLVHCPDTRIIGDIHTLPSLQRGLWNFKSWKHVVIEAGDVVALKILVGW